MLDLSPRQRTVLIDASQNAASVVLAGLGIGQFLSGGPFSAALAVVGFAGWVVLIAFMIFLARRKGR